MATKNFKPIQGPKRTPHDQEFVDMAAIHLFARWMTTAMPADPSVAAANCVRMAEILLEERQKRL